MARQNQPELKDFSPRLLAWFDEHKRDLPWRRDRRPYTVLLSEFMCQQTQVDTVIPYYEDFLRRWPQLEDLAAASEDELREAWAGLGYYRRASHLLACARKVVEKYDGQLPASEAALRELPGIGPYTAAAIASMAFGQPTAAIDGNLLRVLSRCFCIPWQAGDTASMKEVKSLADSLLPPERAGDFNEAMMDLGATICTPRKPDCQSCPFCSTCRARRCGKQEELPLKARSTRQKRLNKPYLLLFVQGRLYLQQRRESLLHGFYEYLPLLRPLQDGESVQLSALLEQPEKSLQPYIRFEHRGKVRLLSTFKHIFSHRIWDISLASVELPALPRPHNGNHESPASAAFSATGHRVAGCDSASIASSIHGLNASSPTAISTTLSRQGVCDFAHLTPGRTEIDRAEPSPLPSGPNMDLSFILQDSNDQELCLPFTLTLTELNEDAPFRSSLCLSDAEMNQENTLERPASGLFTKAEALRLLPPFMAKILDTYDQQG